MNTPTGDEEAVGRISIETSEARSELEEDAAVEVVPQPPLQNIGWIDKGVVRHS